MSRDDQPDTCGHCGDPLERGAWTYACDAGCGQPVCAGCDDVGMGCPQARDDLRIEYAQAVVQARHGLPAEPDDEDDPRVIAWAGRPDLIAEFNLVKLRVPSEDKVDRARLYRGVCFALPISAALWLAIGWISWRAVW